MAHSINFAIVGPSNRNKLSQPFRDLIPTSSDQFRKNLKTLTRVRSASDLSGTILCLITMIWLPGWGCLHELSVHFIFALSCMLWWYQWVMYFDRGMARNNFVRADLHWIWSYFPRVQAFLTVKKYSWLVLSVPRWQTSFPSFQCIHAIHTWNS